MESLRFGSRGRGGAADGGGGGGDAGGVSGGVRKSLVAREACRQVKVKAKPLVTSALSTSTGNRSYVQ